MINRRDAIIGMGCLAGAGGALALEPRRRIDLMGGRTLDGIIPNRLGGWTLDPGIGSMLPPTEGSLADRLYDEILSRGYRFTADQNVPPVMLLGTRGSDQSDALQLHRPETCYPAVGFAIVSRAFTTLTLGTTRVPAVALTAQLGPRVEDIIYWTRIGEDFPQSSEEQRRVRLSAAFRGSVGDGILMRLSSIRSIGGPPVFGAVTACAQAMLSAMKSADRMALIGRG